MSVVLEVKEYEWRSLNKQSKKFNARLFKNRALEEYCWYL